MRLDERSRSDWEHDQPASINGLGWSMNLGLGALSFFSKERSRKEKRVLCCRIQVGPYFRNIDFPDLGSIQRLIIVIWF